MKSPRIVKVYFKDEKSKSIKHYFVIEIKIELTITKGRFFKKTSTTRIQWARARGNGGFHALEFKTIKAAKKYIKFIELKVPKCEVVK